MACFSQSTPPKAWRCVTHCKVRSSAACASPIAMAPMTVRSFWKFFMMA